MKVDRAAYLGPRIRRLRRTLGLTQEAMAADLGISGSYVALLEGNQRPLTAALLLRIAHTYHLDVRELATDDGPDLAARLRAVLKDPLLADLDVPPLQDVDVAANYPSVAEALVRLHAAYREGQLALADRDASPGGRAGADPVSEVRRFLDARRNHFPPLEELGESLAAEASAAGGLEGLVGKRFGLQVRLMPPAAMGGMARRYDPHRRTVLLDERLDRASRRFHLAVQAIYIEARDLLLRLAGEGGFLGDGGPRLARRELAAYGAAAILMPYPGFVAAARDCRHDLELLSRRYDASFEQVAHRLTTLQRPGAEGLPFFFIRVDAAGNVSKRLDGAGFPFARHGGGCPLWSVHDVFRRPGEIVAQWLELPDGQRFLSIARMVTAGAGAHDATRVRRAVAICCPADRAGSITYADAVPSPPVGKATPIGVSCAICQRQACTARAAPPLGRSLLSDDYHRLHAPFAFGD